MKGFYVLLLALVVSTGAWAQSRQFGKAVTEQNAVAADQLRKEMGDKEKALVKVTGVVDDVCQAKGCWMTIKLDNGELMRVKFKDYGFFVPKDIHGRTVVFEGEASVKTTSVAELQHYAKDAGASKEEIAKIDQPKKELTFLANGVLLK